MNPDNRSLIDPPSTTARNTAPGPIFVLCLIACTFMSGCLGYRIGSALPPDIQTVFVPAFANRSGEPELEAETTSAVIRELQRDGTLKVTGPDDADVRLEVTLIGYRLQPLRYSEERPTETTEFRLTLEANVILWKQETGTIVTSNGFVQGESTFEVTGDMSADKLDALPAAAADLAHDIVETVVEAW